MKRLIALKIIKMKLLILLVFSGYCFGQQSQSAEYKLFKNQYPNSHSIRLNQEIHFDITLEDGDIKIVQEVLEEDMYLDDAAIMNSKRSLSFSTFFEINTIEASTYIFDKGKYREVEVKDFKEKDELDQSFYDDTKTINFILPNLKKGAKSKVYYLKTIKDPRFLNAFYFGDFYPIKNNKVSITVSNNINLEFKEFNLEGVDIVFNKEVKRKTTEYTWNLKNSPEYSYEEHTPSYRKILPHIVPVISSYTSNGEEIENLNDVLGLYKWYYSLVENVNNKEPSQELIDIVDTLTRDKKTELEKVKSIFYWVQQNIKYVAFEYALGGFIPREANDVFNKKYGDCKDNSSILAEMLKIANIKGHLTWIGTREIPYKYNDLPTPAVDNHMILAYQNEGETYFLDATGRYIPFGFPTAFIQGKEALVENGEDDFKIINVPIIEAESNAFIDTTNISIKNDKVIGSSKSYLSGYLKIDFYHVLEELNSSEKLKEFYNQEFLKGNNSFLIQDLSEENKFHYDKDMIINYDFEISDLSKRYKDEIYINLNLNKVLSKLRIEEDRTYELEYDYKSFYSYTNKLSIPEGYAISHMPEGGNISNKYMSFSINYELENNELIYTHSVKLDFLTLDLQQQKKVRDFIKKAEKLYKEIIVLKKI